jgi:hypothetical protein
MMLSLFRFVNTTSSSIPIYHRSWMVNELDANNKQRRQQRKTKDDGGPWQSLSTYTTHYSNKKERLPMGKPSTNKIDVKRYATAAVHRNITLKLINNTVLSSKKSSKLSSQRLISYQDLDPK